MYRDTDGSSLIRNRSSDRLTDPPGRIGRELIPASVFELIDRLHQTNIAFLDQVEELETAVGVFLGNRDHESEVRFHHLFLGAASSGFSHAHAAIDLFDFCGR